MVVSIHKIKYCHCTSVHYPVRYSTERKGGGQQELAMKILGPKSIQVDTFHISLHDYSFHMYDYSGM